MSAHLAPSTWGLSQHMTKEEQQAAALADYREHTGRTVLASYIKVWTDYDSIDWYPDPPVLVKVQAGANDKNDIVRYCCGYIDPYWPVRMVDEAGRRALLEKFGVHDDPADCSLAIDGITYNPDGTDQRAEWTNRYKVRPRSLFDRLKAALRPQRWNHAT